MSTSEEDPWWTLYVDGLSNLKGGGAGIILEGPIGITLEHLLKFDFKASRALVVTSFNKSSKASTSFQSPSSSIAQAPCSFICSCECLKALVQNCVNTQERA
ncbi:hypothetical protein CR513_00712, partial [Mucuna pruriens]